MTITAPDGYGNRLVTLDQLRERHGARMHPEYARRLFACIEASEGLVGIGGGWRSTAEQSANYARDRNTFAPPGSSFHETHRFAKGDEWYAAVDTVGRNGEHDRAWNWLRDHAGSFGLRTFWDVNGEPWHVQCNDIPAGVSAWKAAGSPDPRPFELADRSPSNRTSLTESATSTARRDYGPFPDNDDKPVVRIGWHGDLVRYLQSVILDRAGGRIAVDGDFGPRTEARVKDVQAFAKLVASGVVDWAGTWQLIDHLAGRERQPGPPADASVDRVEHGYYWVRRGDSPWRVAERVYGRGDELEQVDPPDPIAPGFAAADHPIRLPNIAGYVTTVLAGDRPWSLIASPSPGLQPCGAARPLLRPQWGRTPDAVPGRRGVPR